MKQKNKNTESNKIISNVFVYIMLFTAILSVSAVSANAWPNPALVNLGGASNFAVISKVAISDTVPTATIITGDIGVSPAPATAITGIACAEVVGTIHVVSAGGATLACQTVDPAFLTPTVLEMEAAYTDALSRASDVTLGGSIGGMTLTPGVYFTASSLGIPTDVNLDCSSTGPSGVFIFQIGGNLDMPAATHVNLIGGCQPGNIFWAVAGTTTIGGGVGTESTFNGNVISGPATSEIAVVTGSTVNGRLLGQKGIALDQNIITKYNAVSAVFTSINLTPQTSTLNITNTKQLTAVGLDQFNFTFATTFNYTSNNTNVATVSNSGLVTAVSEGTATITATSGIVSATSSVIVNNPAPVLTSITLLPSTANITVGNTTHLTATAHDQYGAPIAATILYSTSNSSVAAVSILGVVTGISAGTATITATSGAVSDTSIITVKALPVLASITVAPKTATLIVGQTQQITSAGFDQYNITFATTISYASNHTNVATVNSATGLVTAVSAGTATITATSGTISNTSIITVENAAPVLNHIGPRSVTQGTLLNFTVSATSAGGFNLSYIFIGPITANFVDNNDGTGTFSWMPTLADVGVTSAHFTVTDGTKSASETVSITVNAFQAPITTPTNPAVNLGTANNFVILAKSGISTTGTTSVVGDMGVSPAAASYITGFGLIMDASNQFSTSSLVTGKIYAADYAPPTPAVMTTAISNMETAYTDVAGRASDVTELGAGNIGGLTLASGVYKWGTGVTIPTDVTLSGGANDVWIFQIAQTLDISSGKQVILSGGAQAKNIFWQVAGQTTLGTNSVFNGNILDKTAIVLNTGATLNGRALAQTAVVLDANSVNIVTASNGLIAPNVWQNADYNITLNATGFNDTPIAYINYTLNDVPGQIIGGVGNVLINTEGNNTLMYYAVDTSGNVEAPSIIYALLDKTAPQITSFTLSSTSVNIGVQITGSCTATDNLYANIAGVITGIDTSTSGTKTAKCTATDLAGNVATSTVTYTVNAVSSGGSGGNGGGSGCFTTWSCSAWSDCINGDQTRTCSKDISYCSANPEPALIQSCGINNNPTTTQSSPTTTVSGNSGAINDGTTTTTLTNGNLITGAAVTDTAGNGFWAMLGNWWNAFIGWVAGLFS